jgi:hypothetical protein
MPRQNLQKRAIDEEIISSEEVWETIRYLDPDLGRKKGDLIGIIALLWVVALLFVIGLALHQRGL